jgi:HK97 family phage major capsid protein/HK97 family phage prohead protease
MTIQRAYSLLTIKGFDDDLREISGIATTPSTDRTGDIVEPRGAEFKLPIPVLWQHDSRQPIGHVTHATVTDKGIEIKAKLVKVMEPGRLKDRLDEAWQSMKSGLVGGLSIGFKEIESARIADTYSYRYLKWLWLELSAVTIPANRDCSITAIKSLDQQQRRAASGTSGGGGLIVHLKSLPGVSGSATPIPKPPQGTDTMKIAEQLAAFDTKKKAAADLMDGIMSKAGEEGRSLDQHEKEQYDGAAAEVKEIDEHVARLKAHEARQVASATAVGAASGITEKNAGSSYDLGSRGVLSVRRNVDKGIAFTRYACALMQSKGNLMQAEQIAKKWDDSTPEVGISIKAAVAAGSTSDTTWAAPLVQYNDMVGEFIEYLRNATILGKLTSLRKVPFNTRIPRQTAGVTGAFVGEGAPAPVNKMDFDNITLPWAKAECIVVLTKELARLGSPNAEALARDDLIRGVSEYLDKRFVDPSFAGVANISPASVTFGVTPLASGGQTVAAITDDAERMIRAFVNARLSLQSGAWLMSPETALALSMTRGTQDNFMFPDISQNGGTFFKLPVITSKSVTAAGSPTDGHIVLIDQNEVLLADDGQMMIDASAEASVQMNDAPSAGAQSLVSFWQMGLLGLKVERWIYWTKRRAAAVALLDNVNY